LAAALGILLEEMGKCASAETPPPKRRRADREAVDLLPDDKGKVVWLAAQSSWQVVYTRDDGSTSRMTKHLAVPENDLAGRRLDLVVRDDFRRTLLLTARRRWNELDRSERPRYSSELCEAPESS